MRTIQSTSYDSNGNVSRSVSSENSSWSFAIPNTIGENLLEIFCFGKDDAQTFSDADDYYDEAEELVNSKRFVEAVPLYKKAILLRPKYIYYHLKLSKTLSALNQYQLAILYANKAIEFSDYDNSYLAYHNLGEIYEKQKKFDLSIQSYKRAIDLKTDCSFCESNLKRLYEKLNRNIELLNFYEERLIVRPKDIELLIEIGDLQKKLNKYLASATTYNKALQIAKTKISSVDVAAEDYNQLADIYRKLNQTDSEIETYKQGLELFPENGSLRLGLALRLSSINKFNEAIEEYKLAIKYHRIERGEEAVAWEYSLLADAQEEIGQIKEAIESQKKAFSLESKAYYLVDLANLYKKDRNLELAFKTINEALKQEPTAASYKVKAEIYETQNQISNAKSSYQEAVKLCPKCAWVYISFGEFLLRQKDKVSALKQYEILTRIDPKRASDLLKKIQSN
jgi:tetratricopeptide (TPR) repeat protein